MGELVFADVGLDELIEPLFSSWFVVNSSVGNFVPGSGDLSDLSGESFVAPLAGVLFAFLAISDGNVSDEPLLSSTTLCQIQG